jgi:phosphate-selective porin OprO and OprP
MSPGVRCRTLCAALVAVACSARADEPSARVPAVAGQPSPSASPGDLEGRLRSVEETNKRLLENQQQSDARYRELERRYAELLDRVERTATPTAPAPAPAMPGPVAGPERPADGPGPWDARQATPEPPVQPLVARFDDGVLFGTPDDEFTLRLHVLDQTDFKDFLPNNMFPARSGLYIPRVRVYFEGQLTRPFEYSVSLQRSVDGVWDLLDGFLNIGSSEAFQVRFGRTLVPYSYSWYDHLEQYFIVPERGLFPLNFGLARSAGLMAHGELFEHRIQYAVGGFDGHSNGVADNNNIHDAVAYINVRPFLESEEAPALRHLNLGGSIFLGRQTVPETPLPLRTSLQASENDVAASADSATFLTFNPGVSPLGRRAAGAVHLAWYNQGLSLEAEWQSGRFQYDKLGQSGLTNVPVSGFHVALAYFLTGETVTNRSTVIPLRPFNLRAGQHGLGAVELFARYSQIELGPSVFTAGLANPDESTRQVYMTDVGLNWYPNRFVKFYVDWQLPFYASPVLVNPGTDHFSRSASLFWVRCQVYF